MRNILSLLILALCVLYVPTPAQAFSGQSTRLVYEERTKDSASTKEYLVEKTSRGYRIVLFNQGIKRVIVTDDKLDTQVEDYENPATGDYLTFRRQDGGLQLTGSLDNKPMDKSFEAEGQWFGSVLLLRDAVLAGEEKSEFIVTKPEEERVITLVAIREQTETVMVGGKPCEAVKYKYTVPGFRGMFWKSYYWYRTSDGLLVKTEETRGGPGTPKVYTELKSETTVPEQPAVAQIP